MRFILVDRIERLEKDREGHFVKNVSHSEDYFTDHFPGHPIMPGALILESFEQASKLLIGYSRDFASYPELRRLSQAAFRHFVIPGDRLDIVVQVSPMDDRRLKVKARASADNRLVAEALLEFALVSAEAGAAAERCRRLKEMYELLSSDPVSRAWETLGRRQAVD